MPKTVTTDQTKIPDWCEQDRIVAIDLDEKRIIRRTPNIEHERAVALHDLLQGNRFRVISRQAVTGPYRLLLGIEPPSTLVFSLRNQKDQTPLAAFLETRNPGPTNEQPPELTRLCVDLKPFRRVVRDYFEICESYFDAIKRLPPAKIEALDMARRGIHDEGAEFLSYTMRHSVRIDNNTARRLFALICVLHLR